MGRKSQLEKFESRISKKKADDAVIREAEAKRSHEANSQEAQAKRAMESVGQPTENVFAILTHEGASMWVKMWENSMESVIRKTIREEMKEVVREVIREEMQAAMKGAIQGIKEAMPQPQELEAQLRREIQNQFDFISVPQVNTVNKPTDTDNRTDNEDYIIPRSTRGIQWKRVVEDDKFDVVIRKLLEELPDGIDPTSGKAFKSATSDCNGAYQNFMSRHKGEKGAWKRFIDGLTQ